MAFPKPLPKGLILVPFCNVPRYPSRHFSTKKGIDSAKLACSLGSWGVIPGRSVHSRYTPNRRTGQEVKMKLRIIFIIAALLGVCSSCGKESGPTGPKNTGPKLTEITDQTVNAGETKHVVLSATDQDGDALHFNIPTNPGFLSMTGFSQVDDTVTADLVIAPDENIRGTFDATVRVCDDRGGADSACFIIEVQQPPKIVWGYPGGYVSMEFRYCLGVLCGYTAMPRFRNTGGNGIVEFRASTTPGSVLVKQFNVTEGEQYYRLYIVGGLTSGWQWENRTLTVGSPSAETSWKSTVNEVRGMTISSMELESIP